MTGTAITCVRPTGWLGAGVVWTTSVAVGHTWLAMRNDSGRMVASPAVLRWTQ